MTKKIEKTEFITLSGIANWAKPYKPDEFRGDSRWTLNLTLDEESLARYKEYGIQQKLKQNEHGWSFDPRRPVVKKIKETLVYFTPPFIFDKTGETLVKYTDEESKNVYSYEDKDKKIIRVGDPVLIGNGSLVSIRLSVYPTGMGVGNRLEAIKLIDLITYSPEATEKSDTIEW